MVVLPRMMGDGLVDEWLPPENSEYPLLKELPLLVVALLSEELSLLMEVALGLWCWERKRIKEVQKKGKK